MEIQHLVLRDVGPFRGLHVFDFRGEEGKTGFAVFSKNGRGKTTMFNAMQWCLFGEVFERSRIIDGRRVAGQKRKIVGDVPEPLMNEIAYIDFQIQDGHIHQVQENKFLHKMVFVRESEIH